MANKKPLRTLLIDDSESDASLLLLHLRSLGYAPDARRVENESELKAAFDDGVWDVVLCDFVMPRFDAPRAFAMLRERGLDVPFIIVSGAIGEETAIECMRSGVHDFVLKDRLARLGPAIERELAEARRRREQELTQAKLKATEAALIRSEKLRALGQMAAGIAHDLRNILNPLSLQIEVVRRAVSKADSTQAGSVLHDMDGVLRRGVETVERLSAYSRQARKLEPEPVDLATLAREAWQIARARIVSGNARRSPAFVDELGEPPVVLGEPNEILNAFVNLFVNAIDAMAAGGAITVRTQTSDSRVALSFEDQGAGMPVEVRERVFEPFFTTKGDQGTGLGLAMVYGCMQRHGGEILLESEVGQGSRFTLVFPRTRELVPDTIGESSR